MHDWLTVYAGAERVLEQMLDCYPEADLFSLVDIIPDDGRGFLKGKRVKTSFIQKLPLVKKLYRNYLPLMPLAIEQIDLSDYDLIISSSHSVAKGVITGPNQLHICMCYSPIRYAWDLQHQYLNESGLSKGVKGWIAKYLLHKMRIWDIRTVSGVDQFIAISNFISKRIWKVYRRTSTVIYPPVDIEAFKLCSEKDNFYLTASRMVPYKKMDLIVKSFRLMPNKQLIVIGDGPDFEKIKSCAGGNVTLMGYQSYDVLVWHMQKAKAFIFAAEEDFGIAPLEAQACGTPVIAYGKGGALETIIDSSVNRTGIFFHQQSVESLCEAVDRFEKIASDIDPKDCRDNAMRFSTVNFQHQFISFVDGALKRFHDSSSFMGDSS